ncbi:MAG: hypothetical protein HQL95_03665 [Magnetococcales bacterium]|nr:hypothetical protein [Magnetococcales bacterium]
MNMSNNTDSSKNQQNQHKLSKFLLKHSRLFADIELLLTESIKEKIVTDLKMVPENQSTFILGHTYYYASNQSATVNGLDHRLGQVGKANLEDPKNSESFQSDAPDDGQEHPPSGRNDDQGPVNKPFTACEKFYPALVPDLFNSDFLVPKDAGELILTAMHPQRPLKLGQTRLCVASPRWHWMGGWETELRPGKNDEELRQLGQTLLEVSRPEEVTFAWEPLFSTDENAKAQYDPESCVLIFARLRDINEVMIPFLHPQKKTATGHAQHAYIESVSPAELIVLKELCKDNKPGCLVWTGLTSTTIFLFDQKQKALLVRHLPIGCAHLAHALAEVDYTHVSHAIEDLGNDVSLFDLDALEAMTEKPNQKLQGRFWSERYVNFTHLHNDRDTRMTAIGQHLLIMRNELKKSLDFFTMEMRGNQPENTQIVLPTKMPGLSDFIAEVLTSPAICTCESEFVNSIATPPFPVANFLNGIGKNTTRVLNFDWYKHPLLHMAVPEGEKLWGTYGDTRSIGQETHIPGSARTGDRLAILWSLLSNVFRSHSKVESWTFRDADFIKTAAILIVLALPLYFPLTKINEIKRELNKEFLSNKPENKAHINSDTPRNFLASREAILESWAERHKSFLKSKDENIAETQYPMTHIMTSLSQAMGKEVPFFLTSIETTFDEKSSQSLETLTQGVSAKQYQVKIEGTWEQENPKMEPNRGLKNLLAQLNSKAFVFAANNMEQTVDQTRFNLQDRNKPVIFSITYAAKSDRPTLGSAKQTPSTGTQSKKATQ